MEASKCPKCGDEPLYVEHIDKWYCYGCNTYLGEDAERSAVSPTPAAAEPEEEGESDTQETADKPICPNCGAELELVGEGKEYCFICESYPSSEDPGEKRPEEPIRTEPKKNEAQAFLDSLTMTVPGAAVVESIIAETAEKPPVAIGEPSIEVKPKETEAPKPPIALDIRMCNVCGKPLKWIEKYQRHYCYGCRKYAPKNGVKREPVEPTPKVPPRKMCPHCHAELRYVEKYREYYCYKCKKYPLRGSRKPRGAPSTPNPRMMRLVCPTCADPLRWIEKYQRHYCFSCKQYAPKGYGLEKKSCPLCKGSMKFISEYNEWYCYKCKKYSLRPSKPVLLV